VSETIPQEPSHVFLYSRLGLEWFEEWYKAHKDERAMLDALDAVVREAAAAMTLGAQLLDVSDEELLARRAVWRALESRRTQLQAESNARFTAAYAEFERQNPKPKGWDR